MTAMKRFALLTTMVAMLSVSITRAQPAPATTAPANAPGKIALADLTSDKAQQPERVVYKHVGDLDLPVFVFKPAGWTGQDKRAAIVFIHGGGWAGGDAALMYPHARYFASRGLVTFSVEYRLTQKDHTTPMEAVSDARSAMRWVRSHAADYGIDPGRIASAGESAGGHLAAAVALIDAFDDPADDKSIRPTPDAMLLLDPVIDTTPDGWKVHLPDGSADWCSPQWKGRDKDGSPTHHITRGNPPAILIQGKLDKSVPWQQAQHFADLMKAAGNRCDLVLLEINSHAFALDGLGTAHQVTDTLARLDRFVVSLTWLSGEPTIVVAE
jgi:acetyl esterase